MSGHIRISQDLVFKYAHKHPEYLAFLATYEVDVYRSTVKSVRSYARMWGTSRGTIRRLLADRQRTIDDLQNQIVTPKRGPKTGQRRTTNGPPADHYSSSVSEAVSVSKKQNGAAAPPKSPKPIDLDALRAGFPWLAEEADELVKTCKDYHSLNGRKIKNWQAAARNWFRKHSEFHPELKERWESAQQPTQLDLARAEYEAVKAANPTLTHFQLLEKLGGH